MDRMTEYRQLLDQLDGTPPALDGAVDRARARARRSRTGRRLGIPAARLEDGAVSLKFSPSFFSFHPRPAASKGKISSFRPLSR